MIKYSDIKKLVCKMIIEKVNHYESGIIEIAGREYNIKIDLEEAFTVG